MRSVKYHILWASVFQAVSWHGSDGICSVHCIHVFRLQQSWMTTCQRALPGTVRILHVLDSERRAWWYPQPRKPHLENPACLLRATETWKSLLKLLSSQKVELHSTLCPRLCEHTHRGFHTISIISICLSKVLNPDFTPTCRFQREGGKPRPDCVPLSSCGQLYFQNPISKA